MRLAWIGIVFVGCAIATQANAQQSFELIGRASCATSTCHGGAVGRGPAWNHALTTWVASDPHVGAGLLLRDGDSRAIVERLEPAAAQSEEAFDTVLRQRCISCHATATATECEQTGRLDDAILARGVSCESCHGPASQWLDPHIQSDWTGPRRFEPETGMNDTESILGRASTCARCHIGSRTKDDLVRDMNHDLIAAGHPALRFDLLIYNENLPHHWNTQSVVEQAFNESAVRTRAVGRAINLAAAASLSAERAQSHQQDPTVPWPELADYDCFACHQNLSMREYRLPPTGKSKSPLHVSSGLPIWNAWHSVNNEFEIRENRNALETLSPHLSDPARIAELGRRIASKYQQMAATRMSESPSPRSVLAEIISQLEQPPVDWHQAAIQYLQVDAALRDLSRDDSSGQSARQALQALGDSEVLLRFGAPRGDARYDSPARFDANRFREVLLQAVPNSLQSTPANPAP